MQKITCFYRVVFEIIFLGGTLLYSPSYSMNSCSEFYQPNLTAARAKPASRAIVHVSACKLLDDSGLKG